MAFSYLQQCQRELLPTIDIVWEISRAFHRDADHFIADFYRSVAELEALRDEPDLLQRVVALCDFFYIKQAYSDAPEAVVTSQRILIDRVIAMRTGLPVSLAFLLQEAATYAGLTLALVDAPGYPILRLEQGDRCHFIDPLSGELMTTEQLQQRFSELDDSDDLADGEFSWQALDAANQQDMLVRYLGELKHSLIYERAFEQALIAIDMLLTLLPDDPYEIRDRGYVYEELDCQHVAVDDYEYFLKQCPDDPSAQLLRLQIDSWSTPAQILH
ncbi:SirB1 family protein [Idiomarina xiamenensis]|uniref:Protein SirB1 N-terminal domain-containing protein n=1 Tax=Idiomarina xiamenensis 10-D-4 TaxID=740709 RepID=K2K5D5_9GAMM|nr:tetratricopeptide repeat protein [Idiomarina xiamenensis]EKE82778.1 hypothetical protein A10D4_09239 [Idiomarina xiamenensis 10-D-4]